MPSTKACATKLNLRTDKIYIYSGIACGLGATAALVGAFFTAPMALGLTSGGLAIISIYFLARIYFVRRILFNKQVDELCSSDDNRRGFIVNSLKKIPFLDRPNLIFQVKCLFGYCAEIDTITKSTLMDFLAHEISFNERSRFLEDIRPLVPIPFSSPHLASKLGPLSRIPNGERHTTCKQINQLIMSHFNLDHFLNVLSSLQTVKLNDRPGFVGICKILREHVLLIVLSHQNRNFRYTMEISEKLPWHHKRHVKVCARACSIIVNVIECCDSLPLHRQAKRLLREGIPFTDSSLADMFHRSAELCRPLCVTCSSKKSLKAAKLALIINLCCCVYRRLLYIVIFRKQDPNLWPIFASTIF